MKKKSLILAVSCALISVITPLRAAETTQDSGQDFVVYGRLERVKSSCTVLMSKYVLSLHHSATLLPEQGSPVTSMVPDDHIYIQLGGDNCDAEEGYKNIGLKFVGKADDIDGSVLENTDTSESAATGIGIQLFGMDKSAIVPNVTIARFPAAVSGDGSPTTHPASFPLNLALVKLKNSSVTLGSVKTNLTVQIERL
ncbi:type 1 fimbrial protein [Citrobacter sp. ku-bf4]|uniref:fimbrial protein n=1 Tax=Citrobacter TaxID=544 RepID=UPI00197CCCB6|nr:MULTISPECIES: fimbrial protein [Citrobacter]MBN6044521.1 type 1 fimbrial protein [Citrobacter sp. ku-bf4]MBS0825898.1 type 1 fimbrial protein [Citrobacter amalonaticus]